MIISSKSLSLSPRELEIAKRIASDEKPKEVAIALSLSVSTVDKHVQNLYEKLGIHTVVQLTHWAIANGLVEARAEWGVK